MIGWGIFLQHPLHVSNVFLASSFLRQKTKQKHTKKRRHLDRGPQAHEETDTQAEIHTHQVHIKTNKRTHTHRQLTRMMTGIVGYMINQEGECGLSRRILRLSHTHRIPRIIMGPKQLPTHRFEL